MNEREFEEGRKHLLLYLEALREHVEQAVDLKGNWKMEKPSLHQVPQDPLPPMIKGANHTRYTLNLDLLTSEFMKNHEEVGE